MRLSVCIPVFNVDINPLLLELHAQCEPYPDCEIVVIDDASDKSFRDKNKEHSAGIAQYISLKKNIGRAAIRNRFLKHTTGEFLLFLDCDSRLVKPNFIKRYYDFLQARPRAVYGGTILEPENNQPGRLRYFYSQKHEIKDLSYRLKWPYESFRTNNFLLRRDILEKHRFNSKLKEYGHEDTLFAFRLMQKRVPIDHLENEVKHDGLDSDKLFLKKSKTALKNLAILYREKGDRFHQFVRLLRMYKPLRASKMHVVLLIMSPLLIPVSRVMCLWGILPLQGFKLYKLLYLNFYLSFPRK